MSNILFICHASIGHLNTLLNIAVEMKEASHAVRFITPGASHRLPRFQIFATASAVPDAIRAEDIDVETIRPTIPFLLSAARLPGKTGHAETRHAIGLSTIGIAHFAAQIRRSIEQRRPDIIVSDFAFPAATVAADAEGIPYAFVYHSGLPFRGEGIPPFGSGLPIGPRSPEWEEYEYLEKELIARMDTRVNAARREFSLPEAAPDLMRRPASPWLNIVTSLPEIEAPRGNLTTCTHFVGPCFGRGKTAPSSFPFDQLRPNKIRIYVSLGTVFNDKPDIFRSIMRGLDDPRYQVVVSAGKAFETLRHEPIPSNVLLHARVPQIEILPQMDLVIGHGGNNSTNETLAAGKPLIVLPVGGEQGDNARRIEWLGVGRRLDIQNLREEDLRSSAAEILADPAIRDKSTALKQALAQSGGVREAARLIEGAIGVRSGR